MMVDLAGFVPAVGVHRGKLQSLAEGQGGLVVVLQVAVQAGQQIPGPVVVGVQLYRLFAHGDGLGKQGGILLNLIGLGQHEISHRILGGQFGVSFEIICRLGILFLFVIGVAQVQVDLGQVGVHLDGLEVFGHGVVEFALPVIQVGQAVVGPAVVGVHLQHLAVLGPGLVEHALGQVDVPQPVAQVHVIGGS